MNCFRIPKGLTAAIESLCNRFWWGSQEGKKKMHWATWKAICQPKCAGGMGFRDLECFNQALLAKQGWRILQNPDSLLARMYKQRYFRTSSFFEATCPRTGSFTWRSIMWGKEVIMAGWRWKVGDGLKISIYKDPWLPREKSFKVVSYPKLDPEARVCELLLDDGQWDRAKISSNFLEMDITCIMDIPLPKIAQEDGIRWNYDKKGLFSVRSAYRLAVEMKDPASGSGNMGNMRWWKNLWRMKLPSKIKIFLWRCFHNWLPVKVNLVRRGMKIDSLCPLCGKEHETIIHTVWYCKAAKAVWRSWEQGSVIKTLNGGGIQDFLSGALQKLNKSDFQVFCTLVWSLWNNRNAILFDTPTKPGDQVVDWAVHFIVEYMDANQRRSLDNTQNSRSMVRPKDQRWIPPSQHNFCVNVDAGFSEKNRCFSTGVVIRNWRGEVKASGCKKYNWLAEVSVGEAIAVRDGIMLANEELLTPFVVVSDSKVAVEGFKNKTVLLNDIGTIVRDCYNLDIDSHCTGVEYASRRTNRAAHTLAKYALDMGEGSCIWKDSVPHIITQIVMAEASACLLD